MRNGARAAPDLCVARSPQYWGTGGLIRYLLRSLFVPLRVLRGFKALHLRQSAPSAERPPFAVRADERARVSGLNHGSPVPPGALIPALRHYHETWTRGMLSFRASS